MPNLSFSAQLVRSTDAAPASLLEHLWREAESAGDVAAVAELAARSDLPSALDAAARTHPKAAVRAAWLGRPGHDQATLDEAVASETAASAFVALARTSDNAGMLRAIARRDTMTLRKALAQNPALPADVLCVVAADLLGPRSGTLSNAASAALLSKVLACPSAHDPVARVIRFARGNDELLRSEAIGDVALAHLVECAHDQFVASQHTKGHGSQSHVWAQRRFESVLARVAVHPGRGPVSLGVARRFADSVTDPAVREALEAARPGTGALPAQVEASATADLARLCALVRSVPTAPVAAAVVTNPVCDRAVAREAARVVAGSGLLNQVRRSGGVSDDVLVGVLEGAPVLCAPARSWLDSDQLARVARRLFDDHAADRDEMPEGFWALCAVCAGLSAAEAELLPVAVIGRLPPATGTALAARVVAEVGVTAGACDAGPWRLLDTLSGQGAWNVRDLLDTARALEVTV